MKDEHSKGLPFQGTSPSPLCVVSEDKVSPASIAQLPTPLSFSSCPFWDSLETDSQYKTQSPTLNNLGLSPNCSIFLSPTLPAMPKLGRGGKFQSKCLTLTGKMTQKYSVFGKPEKKQIQWYPELHSTICLPTEVFRERIVFYSFFLVVFSKLHWNVLQLLRIRNLVLSKWEESFSLFVQTKVRIKILKNNIKQEEF